MKKEEQSVAQAMRAGFTLVELLVVVAIIGILGTIAVQNITGHIASTRITAAESGVQSLKEACTSYNLKHKKFPTSLDQLTEGDDPILDSDKYLYDPWDTKYEMETKKNRVIIKSAGPDGQMGTEDDITTTDKKKAN